MFGSSGSLSLSFHDMYCIEQNSGGWGGKGILADLVNYTVSKVFHLQIPTI